MGREAGCMDASLLTKEAAHEIYIDRSIVGVGEKGYEDLTPARPINTTNADIADQNLCQSVRSA
jgi:hypothetical protein